MKTANFFTAFLFSFFFTAPSRAATNVSGVDDNSVGGITGNGTPVPGSWRSIFFLAENNDLSGCKLDYISR